MSDFDDIDLGQFPPQRGMFAAPRFMYDREFLGLGGEYASQLTSIAIETTVNKLCDMVNLDPDLCTDQEETILMAMKLDEGFGAIFLYNTGDERPQMLFAPWPIIEISMSITLKITEREGGIVGISRETATAFEKLTGLSCN